MSNLFIVTIQNLSSFDGSIQKKPHKHQTLVIRHY